MEPVAIVGIGCRYPGRANNPSSLWQLLIHGKDAISQIPVTRFETRGLYHPQPGTAGKIASDKGGFLEDLDLFDANAFHITPREAPFIDPQQRLLLELAREALDDAGQVINDQKVGIYVGIWTGDYEDQMFAATSDINLYITTGGGRYAAAGRISYALNLQGPSMAIDTACSSSLVAVHLACQALRNGECAMALAGGVNVILQPHITIGYSRSRMLSPDGHCKFGDARADGYVRSEGAGMVLLKPLSAALADRDDIYAVILGSAINNDGQRGHSLVAPGVQAQQELLREAYRAAGVSPAEVHYVEAHGTGTSVGDATELQALGMFLADGRKPEQPCYIGSIKTNIGHTEAASGIAGIIKAALSLKHGIIPPSLHHQQPTSAIPWEDLPLRISTSPIPWTGQRRIAGVNSFGVTGTNAHAVLAEAPVSPPIEQQEQRSRRFFLPVTAHSSQAVSEVARQWAQWLTEDTALSLADFCYTASRRRTQHAYRQLITGTTKEDVIAALLELAQQPLEQDEQTTPSGIVFVFPGQGGQWPGMARYLLETEPVFKQAMEACEPFIQKYSHFSLLAECLAPPEQPTSQAIDIVQPTLFALEYALAALWRSWGIEPTAVIGHSMGEVAAACCSNILTLDDAARIICLRSQLLRRISGKGAMALIEVGIERARQALQGYEDLVAIAASNSPSTTVLSGDTAALNTIVQQLQQKGVFCRFIKVDAASHSPQVDSLREDLRQMLAPLQPRSAQIPFYSTVTGNCCLGSELNADYWVHNLRNPVLFAQTVQSLNQVENTIFIEISPHPVLLTSLRETTGTSHTSIPSFYRENPTALYRSLGTLYSMGCQLNWQQLYPEAGNHVHLPPYPWQRQRFWFSDVLPASNASMQQSHKQHGLLGQHFEGALPARSHYWDIPVSPEFPIYLRDHRVREKALLPATFYLTLVMEALASLSQATPYSIEQMEIKEALLLSEAVTRSLQLLLLPTGEKCYSFKLLSRRKGEERAQWVCHVQGNIRVAVQHSSSSEPFTPQRSNPQPAEKLYDLLQKHQLFYGPAFQTVKQYWQGERSTLAELHVVEESQTASPHPALLDAGLQLAVASFLKASDDATYLPVSFEHIHIYRTDSLPHWCRVHSSNHTNHATRHDGATSDTEKGDITFYDVHRQPLLEMKDVSFQRIQGMQKHIPLELLYNLEWHPFTPSPPSALPAGKWLLLADNSAVSRQLCTHLEAQGEQCHIVSLTEHLQLAGENPAAYRDLLAEFVTQEQWSGIIHACIDASDETTQSSYLSLLFLIQALHTLSLASTPRLWVLSQGVPLLPSDSGNALAQACTWGLTRTIRLEYPNLRASLIDLGNNAKLELCSNLLLLNASEDEYAIREDTVYVPRLQLSTNTASPQQPIRADGRPFMLVQTKEGTLDGLALHETRRQKPGPQEVEIEVLVAGLNFRDVLKALGLYPDTGAHTLGDECVGRVVAVGEHVTEIQPGDEVLAVAKHCFGTHALADARLVIPKPAHLLPEEAATLPVAFITAFYALNVLARLQAGERILIHSAAGGVGLAAVQLAQLAGAEILATASSAEKHSYLQSLGIRHILDSRSLSFVNEVREITGGQGVDVVFNSLAGDFLSASLSLLAPNGRFLELGKRDVYQDMNLNLSTLKENKAFFVVDMERLWREKPLSVRSLLLELKRLVEEKQLHPLPYRAIPISRATDGFREMARGKHIGKFVLTFQDKDAMISPLPQKLFRADASYLITGGTGGLGQAFASWMLKEGARTIILASRSAAQTEVPAALLTEAEAVGGRIQPIQTDITVEKEVSALFQQIQQHAPPLRGIIHAAGLLEDQTLSGLTPDHFTHVMSPKVAGSWLLHQQTQHLALDFFVLCSSVTSVLGSPGQGNYTAANSFLDALAHYRRARGLPALSINWGPWAHIGLAAAEKRRGERLAQQGLGSILPEEGLQILRYLLEQKPIQAIVMPLDVQKWDSGHHHPLFQLLLSQGKQPDPEEPGVRDVLLASTGARAVHILETLLREQVTKILHLDGNRLGRAVSLRTLGIDSLMALELKNSLADILHLPLPGTLIFNYPTIASLAQHLHTLLLAEKEATPLPSEGSVKPEEQSPSTIDEEQISHLSDEEVETLLLQELADLE